MSHKPVLLRFHPETDSDISGWLETVPDDHGAKASAIKAKLRAALSGTSTNVASEAILETDALLAELLPAIRQVVERAVRNELDNLRLTTAETLLTDDITSAEDPLNDKLDQLGVELMNDE